MPAGRPLKFNDLDKLNKQIDMYFEMCKKASEPYTITGLALYLDTSRQTLLEYEGEVKGRDDKDPEFVDAIKRAKLKVENWAEIRLLNSPHAAGAIFALKNFGWKDERQIQQTNTEGKLSPEKEKEMDEAGNRNKKKKKKEKPVEEKKDEKTT